MLHGGEVRKLFNTSYKDYRDPEIKELPPTYRSSDARLVEGTRNLIKRPLLLAMA